MCFIWLYEIIFVPLQAKICVRIYVKRILYILGVLVVSLLLVSGMVVAALMSDKVETAAVRLVTAELSRALGTHATVGAVEYRFPARVAVKDVYLEDQRGDTLAFVGELYAHFSPLALRDGEVRFSHVRLSDVVADVHRLPDSTWNYQFLVDAFKSGKKEKQPLRSLISVRDVQLDNIRLRYEDYRIYLSHSAMDLHGLSEETVDAEIREMAMRVSKPSVVSRQPSEFIVENLQAHVILTDTMLAAPALRAQLPQSRLDLSGVEVRLPADNMLAPNGPAEEIHFALRFNEADLVPSEIALFLPNLRSMKKPFTLRGELDGTLDSLAFNGLTMQYNGRTFLEGNVCAIGLPDINNPYLMANLTDVHTNAAELQDLLSQLQGRPVRLPKQLHRLGDIHYRGLASGKLRDLTLHGAFRTALGAITTDGSFRADSLFDHMTYDARVVARNFRLGRMLGVKKLGTVTVDVSSAGAIDEGKVNGDVKAHARKLTYNNYTYADLSLNGHYSPQRYMGSFAIHDPHLDVSFDGVVDTRDASPEVNCNLVCRHFDSAPLELPWVGDRLRTRFSLAIDMSGTNPDDISGYAVLDSLYLATSRDSLLMRQMKLIASAGADGSKAVTLTADYMNGEVDGEFRYRDIVPAAQALIHHYLPTAVATPKQEWRPVEFFLSLQGERLRDVQRLFAAPLTISDHPTLTADVSVAPEREGKEPQVNLRFFAPGVLAGNTPVHELTVTLNTIDTLRHTGANGSGLALSVSAEAMQMHSVVSMLAFRDTVMTHLTMRQEAHMSELLPEGWEKLTPRELQRALSNDLTNKERLQALLAAQRAGDYGGDIKFITHFSQYNRKPLVEMHFQPGTLLLRDSLYTLDESRIVYCAADTSLQVDHFAFSGGGQHIRANGMASRRAQDTIEVDLLKLQAGYIVPFLLPVQTIMFNGLLTGRANISSLFSAPKVDTQIHIDSMGLNNCYFGDADVDLHIRDSLAFHADVYRPKRKLVDLNGKALFDKSGVWELDMHADSVPLEFVNHWTATVLKDLDGYGTGRIVVGGRKGMTYVLLRCAAENASLTLPWTGVRYTIASDTIVMDTTAILFPNVRLTDAQGNKVEVNGGVYHDQFRDFGLDLHVDAHDALVFNKNTKGEMMQGTVYATGHVDVTGSQDDIIVAADARTSRNSKFRLSLDNVSSAYESSFVHFVEHPDTTQASIVETDLDNIDIKRVAGVDSSMYMRAGRCLLKLNLEVNPYLLFQLVLGERNGDVIQARGNGALQLAYDTGSGEVSLLGTYDIDKGTLSYTVANVIRKEFTVGAGSTIAFSGDAANPQLNVTANYRVTASLKDLFGEDMDKLGLARSSIPVTTSLHLTGPLNNPILSFSLEFPTSDQSVQQQVRQIINTDEMLMRQVIYLLVFGRFFTPDYMSNSQYATLNSTYSLLSSTVTSQINAWLSKLTDMLTLGVAIRQDGLGGAVNQEYEAQFQLQPVDRLVINGNVGYRYNHFSNQPFFGDLDVEVLLTEDGQWRLKGYTHMVDKYSLRQASTIQGIGFMWKKDF